MRIHMIASLAVILSLTAPAASIAQQTPSRSVPALDFAAIRKQSAQLAEIRAILADPDPNVRLLAIREIARSSDPIQRQLALDVGLSSAELSMQEVALRALLTETNQLYITLSKMDGSPITTGENAIGLTVVKFDANTGLFSGGSWTGQIQGAVFSFMGVNGLSGSLVWGPEAGEFSGVVNVNYKNVVGDRKAVWRPR